LKETAVMLVRSIAVVSSLAFLAVSFGCRRDPHIISFTVAPQNACVGDIVEATWTTTSDSVRLATSTGAIGLDSGGPNSSFGADVQEDTIFTLSARIEDRSDTATRRVTVRTPLEFSEVIQVECEGSSPRFRTLVYEAAQYSSRFKAVSIRNLSTRPVTVGHLTINRPLGPGEEVTDADFGRVDLVGEWRITTALPANACEQQSVGGGPPPPNLPRLQVRLAAACR
jgi:hypothetical protein